MPKIQISPAVVADLHQLIKIDHSGNSDYVWQMDIMKEDGQIWTKFREIRLPRKIAIDYPRDPSLLIDEWSRRVGTLVANIGSEIVGYIRLSAKFIPKTAWISDVVVVPSLRRNGIGTALILAGQTWARGRSAKQAIIEVSSNNIAGIRMAQKLNFEFCGYNDQYYVTRDIALYFGRSL